MLNNTFLSNIILIPVLILLQVFVFNNILFFNQYCPIVYIIGVVFYPYSKSEKYWFIIFAFILGLGVDFFMDTGGINAFATTLIAYTRNSIIRFVTDLHKEMKVFNFSDLNIIQFASYLFLIIFIHHLFVFALESFKISMFLIIIKEALITTIFSFLFIVIIYTFIKNKIER